MLLGLRPVASVPISAPRRAESGGLTAILNSLSAFSARAVRLGRAVSLAVEDSALLSVLADISHFTFSIESRVVTHSLTLAKGKTDDTHDEAS